MHIFRCVIKCTIIHCLDHIKALSSTSDLVSKVMQYVTDFERGVFDVVISKEHKDTWVESHLDVMSSCCWDEDFIAEDSLLASQVYMYCTEREYGKEGNMCITRT